MIRPDLILDMADEAHRREVRQRYIIARIIEIGQDAIANNEPLRGISDRAYVIATQEFGEEHGNAFH